MGGTTKLFTAYFKSNKSQPSHWFGLEVEPMKACDTAAQGPNAPHGMSYRICLGLLIILILFG